MPLGVISLVFFCGRHLEMDKYQGAEDMVRSLVAQLLRQFPFPTVHPTLEFQWKPSEKGTSGISAGSSCR